MINKLLSHFLLGVVATGFSFTLSHDFAVNNLIPPVSIITIGTMSNQHAQQTQIISEVPFLHKVDIYHSRFSIDHITYIFYEIMQFPMSHAIRAGPIVF